MTKLRLRNTIRYRILNLYNENMKVTALIPDSLIEDVKIFSAGENITQSLIIALNEWVSKEKIKRLNTVIKSDSLRFKQNFQARSIRILNRK